MRVRSISFSILLSISIIKSSYPIRDGTLLSYEPFMPEEYSTLDEQYKKIVSPESYAQSLVWYAQNRECVFYKIRYSSDNLAITGIVGKPAQFTYHKYPVLIYNRGGYQEFGKVIVSTLRYLAFFIKQGYIVLASQYRGNDGSEGQDTFGGADVHDVLNLITYAYSLPYADTSAFYMLGYSRGGMMTYQALKAGAPITAAAVISGPTDLLAQAQERPELEHTILARLIPDYATHATTALIERSASYWPSVFTTPLLLIHGQKDEKVTVTHAQKLANQLEQLGKKHKLIIYPDGDHALKPYRTQTNEQVLDWFRSHTTKGHGKKGNDYLLSSKTGNNTCT